jgi:hypothetical protein
LASGDEPVDDDRQRALGRGLTFAHWCERDPRAVGAFALVLDGN